MALPTTAVSPNLTAQRLHQLTKLYEQGRLTPVVERALIKILQYEADTCRAQLQTLRAEFHPTHADPALER